MNEPVHVLSVLHVDLLRENLSRYLRGKPLLNLVQRELGY